MPTNSSRITSPPIGSSVAFSRPNPGRSSCLFLRRFLVVGVVLLTGFAASPAALAGGADGIYKPTHVSGSVGLAGKTYNLPLGPLKDALLKKGLVWVRNNRIPIQRDKWGKVLEEMGLFGIRGKAAVSGPGEMVFRKTRKGYAGRAKDPIVVKIRGRYKRLPVTMTLRTRLESTVEGDVFRVNAPVEITVIGLSLKGRIKMNASRVTIYRPVTGL